MTPVHACEPRTSGQLLRGILFTHVNGIRITLTCDVSSKWKLWPDSEGICAICMQKEREREGGGGSGVCLEPLLLSSGLTFRYRASSI